MLELSRTSLSEQIYLELRKGIIMQNIPCGQKLTLRELQERFNVSSTPVREALTRLDQEGLVEFTTNQGAKVIELTLQDMLEVHDLCALHDGYAVRLAMQLPERENLNKELLKALEEQRIFCERMDTEENSYYDITFHSVFYRYTSNKRLKNIANQLLGLTGIIFIRSTGHRYLWESYDEHKAVYQAVLNNDVEQAVLNMHAHLEKGKERLIKQYNNMRKEGVAN